MFLPLSPSGLPAELNQVDSSQSLFADIVQRNEEKQSSICPRFTVPAPTEWDRIGYGGNGIQRDSGLYLGTRGQYTTTNDM